MNPNNEKYITSGINYGYISEEVANNLPFTLRTISLVYFIIMLIGSFLVNAPKSE